jgi:hypothetical protein
LIALMIIIRTRTDELAFTDDRFGHAPMLKEECLARSALSPEPSALSVASRRGRTRGPRL